MMSLLSFSVLQFFPCGPETVVVNSGGTQQQIIVLLPCLDYFIYDYLHRVAAPKCKSAAPGTC